MSDNVHPSLCVESLDPSPAADRVLLALGEVEVHVSEHRAELLARDLFLVVRIEVLKNRKGIKINDGMIVGELNRELMPSKKSVLCSKKASSGSEAAAGGGGTRYHAWP